MQGGQLGLAIFIVVAIIAINGSNKRWQTFLLILLSCAVGLGIGAGVGWLTGNMGAGGSLAGILLTVCGIGVSVILISENSKAKKAGPT